MAPKIVDAWMGYNGGGGPLIAKYWVDARGVNDKAGFLAFARRHTAELAEDLTGEAWPEAEDRTHVLWNTIQRAPKRVYQQAVHDWHQVNAAPAGITADGEIEPAEIPPAPVDEYPEPEPVEDLQPAPETIIQQPEPGPPEEITPAGISIIPATSSAPDAPSPEENYMAWDNSPAATWFFDSVRKSPEGSDFVPVLVKLVEGFGYTDVQENHFVVQELQSRINVVRAGGTDTGGTGNVATKPAVGPATTASGAVVENKGGAGAEDDNTGTQAATVVNDVVNGATRSVPQVIDGQGRMFPDSPLKNVLAAAAVIVGGLWVLNR